MKKSYMTQKYLKEVLDYNPLTGDFFWKFTGSGRRLDRPAGCLKDLKGYWMICVDSARYRAHRLAWLYVYGEWPKHIDHINHNKADNRIENLRSVTHAENQRNRGLTAANTSGVNGVSFYKQRGKWQVSIRVYGELKGLGLYTSIEDAEKARKEANIKYGFHQNHGSNP